ncbi:MAG TPA: hypothetical protein VML35_01725 [Gaiellaceae bacterium]|nr:hypothetical protein [Gaiellaceae bacterium]
MALSRADPPSPTIVTIPVSPRQPRRRALRSLGLLAALAALLVVAAPATAAQSCGRQVIDDWYDDGRVDGTYALHCYDDAIEILPRDVRDYSSAKEDIQRALQARLRGEPAPPATTDPSPGGPGDDPVETLPTETTPGGSAGGGGSGDPGGGGSEAGPLVDTESASSVPVPLLILAGLALLLVAGGSAGYVLRRLQARRLPPSAV